MMKLNFSRRDFIKLAGVGVPYVIGLSVGGGILKAAECCWKSPVSDTMTREFEEEFNIGLFNPKRPVKTYDISVRRGLGIKAQNGLIDHAVQTLVGWNNAELHALIETLKQLPVLLRTSPKGRIIVGIGEYKPLTSSGEGGFKGALFVGIEDDVVYDFLTDKIVLDSTPPVIIFSERDIYRNIFQSDSHPKMVIVHELAHMYQNNYDQGKENPLIQQALEICGVRRKIDFRQPCGDLLSKFSRSCEVDRDLSGGIVRVSCKEDDRMGIIGLSPRDLIPVASELYFDGEPELCSSFSPIIGETGANQLCGLIRRTIFGGKKYVHCFSVN